MSKKAPTVKSAPDSGMASLKGQFLVAMPMMRDERFTESVLLIIEHNGDGAMAIAINEILPSVLFGDVLSDLKLESPSAAPNDTPIQISDLMAAKSVLRGGPVQPARGFVLRLGEYAPEDNSLIISGKTYLSANMDGLRVMAAETNPKNSLFALGYCGWSPGQLEEELAQNAWLTVPFDQDLVFNVPYKKRYEKALGLLGITRASLSAFSGNA
jgi:putative transcriptional regulator